MKIVLASYFEEENHGSGRKIGISPSKPQNLSYECQFVHRDFSPEDLYWDYNRDKKVDIESAAARFIEGYKEKLDRFFSELDNASKKLGKSKFEILGLMDGDTLLSWERKGNTSYRSILAEFLREIGYEVIEN